MPYGFEIVGLMEKPKAQSTSSLDVNLSAWVLQFGCGISKTPKTWKMVTSLRFVESFPNISYKNLLLVMIAMENHSFQFLQRSSMLVP